jgi:hypothetical protein
LFGQKVIPPWVFLPLCGMDGDAAKLQNTVRVEARVPGLRRRQCLATSVHAPSTRELKPLEDSYADLAPWSDDRCPVYTAPNFVDF